MIQIRKASERGSTRLSWLDSRHSFSFGDYYDPEKSGFRALRVINDDRIAGGGGFGLHPHRDMEIVTYVLEGALEHRDSLGSGGILKPGELQHMTAGTGINHSEFNASQTEPVHLYQIWLLPNRKGLAPGYEQKSFNASDWQSRFRTVASPTGAEGALRIHQDVEISLTSLHGTEAQKHLAAGRHAWLQVLRGQVELNGQPLHAGDGAAVSDERAITVASKDRSEIMIFDLA